LPTTYMNQSGVAVRKYLDFFKLDKKKVVIVVDDIAHLFGELRLKTMGSSGGHNGLKSIEAHLGIREYTRLKMGIGHPGEKVLSDYVLDPFNKEELEQLVTFIDRGVNVLERLVNEDVSEVMKSVNTTPRI
jgi:PTH1 family peptidyl-tRNA hydrolase